MHAGIAAIVRASLPATPAEANYSMFGANGTSQSISFGDDFEFAGDDFTINMWVEFDAFTNASPTFASKWGAGASNYKSWHFFYNGGNLYFTYSTNGSSQTALSVPWTPTINTTYMVTVKRESTNIRFFVDGVQQGTNKSISTNVIHNSDRIIRVGVYEDAGILQPSGFMEGSMTMAHVSNIRAFSDAEITALYQAGKTPYPETLPTSITDDTSLLVEMSSRDNSLTNLYGSASNGTATGSMTSDGVLQTFTPYV